jgi:hypothetical protein
MVLDFSSVESRQVRGRGRDFLQSYADRVTRLSSLVEEYKPDLLISDLDPAAVRTAFGLGVPTWTVYSSKQRDARPSATEKMSFALCDKILASGLLEEDEIIRQGIPSKKLVRFNGLNECYLKPSDYRNGRTRVLVRGNGHTQSRWARKLINGLMNCAEDLKVTILGSPVGGIISPAKGVRVLDFTPFPPVLDQDLYIGWGRMTAESYVLGMPTIRTVRETYTDLDRVYCTQPEIDDPTKICETAMNMIREGESFIPPRDLESPIAALESRLAEDGYI